MSTRSAADPVAVESRQGGLVARVRRSVATEDRRPAVIGFAAGALMALATLSFWLLRG